jgi:hypothetical protein
MAGQYARRLLRWKHRKTVCNVRKKDARMAPIDPPDDSSDPMPGFVNAWLLDPVSQKEALEARRAVLKNLQQLCASALQLHEEVQARMAREMKAQSRYGKWSGAIGLATFVGFMCLSVWTLFNTSPDLASPAVALAQLLAHFGPAVLGLLIASYFLERYESDFWKVKQCESTLAFLTGMDLALCAAVTFGKPNAVDRVIDGLVAAHKDGALSSSPGAAAGARTRAWPGMGLIERLVQMFVKRG